MSPKCEIISLFRNAEMNKQAMRDLFFHVEEVLDIWTWHTAHTHAQANEAMSKFQSTLSYLPEMSRQYSPTVDFCLGLQSLLSKSSLTSDHRIIPLRIQVSRPPIEEAFHQAIRHFEAGQWALAMNLLNSQDSAIDVLVSLEEKYLAGESSSSSPRLADHELEYGMARLTRREFDTQLAMCRASQLMHTGDCHFREAETGIAEDMMGRAQLAQDDYRLVSTISCWSCGQVTALTHIYRAALLCVAGQDIELEGAALARLARFYTKIVKLPVPFVSYPIVSYFHAYQFGSRSAHQLYLRAVQLAASLSPTLPKGDWYKESVDAVQAHRDELQAQEANEWAAKREPILAKLAVDIEKLRSKNHMGDREFCQVQITLLAIN
jgi:hypothetical protein